MTFSGPKIPHSHVEMKKIICLITICFVIFLLLLSAQTGGISISATGDWTETIDAFDLVSGAGSDLIDTYESIANATVLTITAAGGGGGKPWRIDVKRTDSNWHTDFTLYVRRTSDGTGPGSISGGLSYIEIVTTDSSFFSGVDNRSGIDVQYELTGMSVSVPPAIYSTTVTYTVVKL